MYLRYVQFVNVKARKRRNSNVVSTCTVLRAETFVKYGTLDSAR